MARTIGSEPFSKALKWQPLSVYGIVGPTGSNDALFRPAIPRFNSEKNSEPKTLVFFGGDVQNFFYLMDQNEPKIESERWCLETTAIRLGASFPSHHIVIIKPARTAFEHVSCYDNFVESNFIGTPKFTYCYRGLLHLECLLMKLSKKIQLMPSEELFKMLLSGEDEDFQGDNYTEDMVWQYEILTAKKKEFLCAWQKQLNLEKYPITLIAFSKGCVVLNQFLYEFHYAKRLEPRNQDSRFVDLIEAMYWLDAGHPGRNNVYPTSRGMLKTLTELGIKVHIHVSPYQTEDVIRPWIRSQYLEFIQTLRSLKAKLLFLRHLSDLTGLWSHFDVLYSFTETEPSFLESMSTAQTHTFLLFAIPEMRRPRPLPTSNDIQVQSQLVGLSLVDPDWIPYLALQQILRTPLQEGSGIYDPQNSFYSESDYNTYVDTQNPNSDDTQNDSTAQPSTSRIVRPNFEVIITKKAGRINFFEDNEAAEAFRRRRHFKLETPVVATLTEWPAEPALSIYSPVNEIYTPLLWNSESAAAADTRPPGADSADNPMNNVSAASQLNVSPNNESQTATNAQPSRISQTISRVAQPLHNFQAAPTAAQPSNIWQAAPRAIQPPNIWRVGPRATQPCISQAPPRTAHPYSTSTAAQPVNNVQAAPTAAQPSNIWKAGPEAIQPPNIWRAVRPSITLKAAPRASFLPNTSRPIRVAAPSTSQGATSQAINEPASSGQTTRDRMLHRFSKSNKTVPSLTLQSSSDDQPTSRVVPIDGHSIDTLESDAQPDSASITRRILRYRRRNASDNGTGTKR